MNEDEPIRVVRHVGPMSYTPEVGYRLGLKIPRRWRLYFWLREKRGWLWRWLFG